MLPFYGQYPAGYNPSTDSATSSEPKRGGDIVDIRSSRSSGSFTVVAGDRLALSDLYKGTAPPGGSIAGYRVALRSDPAAPGNGQLLLGERDVTHQLSFTDDEFSRLHFVAGPSGSKQDLVVVAQTGKRTPGGALLDVIDSPAVQITASVTGTRSINAIGALVTAPTGDDTEFVKVAQEASIFTGYGQARPNLATMGRPYDPQTPVELLASLLGAFQSSGTSLAKPAAGLTETAFDVSPLYVNTNGGSLRLQSIDLQQNDAQRLAVWLLGASDLSGFQTGGNSFVLQRFAVAAYQTNQRTW